MHGCLWRCDGPSCLQRLQLLSRRPLWRRKLEAITYISHLKCPIYCGGTAWKHPSSVLSHCSQDNLLSQETSLNFCLWACDQEVDMQDVQRNST